jgi:hypothetical protein
MSLATGANFEFCLDCLVRTNRTSCVMLKVVQELKTEPILVCVLFKVKFLPSLLSVDVLLSKDLLWLFV